MFCKDDNKSNNANNNNDTQQTIMWEQLFPELLQQSSRIISFDQYVIAQGEINSVFSNWKCFNCGTEDLQNLQESLDYNICVLCGAVQKDLGMVMLDSIPDDSADKNKNVSYYVSRKRDKDGNVIKGKTSYGTAVRRRYKRKFYYRERLAQWLCQEPPVKPSVMSIFEELMINGDYGTKRNLSRGTIYQMCKEHKLCRYKENWKSILYHLKGKTPNNPQPDVLHYCSLMFGRISKRFDRVSKNEMAKYIKGSKGKPRHHILHVNYIHRKILEMYGLLDYHREFPLLRTPSKIHTLDDVMQVIAAQTQMPFCRTAVIVPPKYKNKNKKKLK
jgi:hypothetical protein